MNSLQSFKTIQFPDTAPRSRLERVLAHMADVRSGEGVEVVLLAFNLFLLLAAYYMLKTVREALILTEGDIAERIAALADASVDAILHDPPRFGIAGELYAQVFYDQLSRVLRRRGVLFHYTGRPNKLTTGRDVPNEVATRLRRAGFRTELEGDGVLAVKGERR